MIQSYQTTVLIEPCFLTSASLHGYTVLSRRQIAYIKQSQPSSRVANCEQKTLGFGE